VWNYSWQTEPIRSCKLSFDSSLLLRHSIRRLSAGHTAIHIACQLGNVIILHMFLSLKKEGERTDEDNEEAKQHQEEKHMYECLRIKDHADLTPIHWAATQEAVSKRQKMFAYLDQRMPGILDSRYNMDWFHSWTKTHPWVIESKTTKILPIV
jgi:ankyrin repeat protein